VALFVAGAYWYLYGREQPSPADDGEARFAREREPSLMR
jgi:hypothetical protein